MKEPKTLNFMWISKLLNKGLPQKNVRGPKTFAHLLKEKTHMVPTLVPTLL
jgi:hypothetical protein